MLRPEMAQRTALIALQRALRASEIWNCAGTRCSTRSLADPRSIAQQQGNGNVLYLGQVR